MSSSTDKMFNEERSEEADKNTPKNVASDAESSQIENNNHERKLENVPKEKGLTNSTPNASGEKPKETVKAELSSDEIQRIAKQIGILNEHNHMKNVDLLEEKTQEILGQQCQFEKRLMQLSRFCSSFDRWKMISVGVFFLCGIAVGFLGAAVFFHYEHASI